MQEHDHENGVARPYLGTLSASLVTSYASLLGDINGVIAEGLRTMQKSIRHLRLIQGGKSATLMKASAAAPQAKAPKVAVPSENVKIDAPGSRGGKWYRDEHGNVRYGTKPTPRFHTALSDDEEKQLHTNLNASIQEMSYSNLASLARVMKVKPTVVDTLRLVVTQATAQGLDPQQYFAEQYAASLSDDPDNLDPKALEEGNELYGNMVASFKDATNSDNWAKAAKRSLARQRQQAVNAAQAADRQRGIVKGHFDALVSGDAAHESIKSLAVMHDLGFFTLPATFAEAKAYTDDEDLARRMVGVARINTDRANAVLKHGDALEAEQQAALVAMVMLGEEQAARDDDPLLDRDQFWKGMEDHPGLDQLRDWLHAGGKEYSDAEWAQVKERTLMMARHVSDHMSAYNDNQGGHVFKALYHNTTTLKKLFEDPKEVENLHEVEAAVQARLVRAVKAQTDYTHEIEPEIMDALKKSMGDNADMFGFQKAAVAWMKEIKSGVLAYDAGLGKTPISIALMASLMKSGKIKRGIMVLPANLVAQWPKEIAKFMPNAKVQVISSGTGDVDERLLKLRAINSGELEADFVIMSAGTIGLHKDTHAAIEEESNALLEKQGKVGGNLSKEERARLITEGGHLDNDPLVQELKKLDGAMMFDEAHHAGQGLKDPTNNHHLVAREVLKDREYKFGMTATPMPDGPQDLYHLSNLFHPGSAGESLAKFSNRLIKYETHYDETTGEARSVPVDRDMKELAAAKEAIKPYVFFQRKTAKHVQDEMEAKGMKLPKINAVSHALALTPEARKLYEDCREMGFDEGKEPLYGHPEGYLPDKEMHAHLSEKYGADKADMVLKMRGFIRQQRAAISPRLLDKSYKGPNPKIDSSIDIIKRHFADPENHDKPVVVFGSWMDSLDLMKDELVKSGVPEHLIGRISGDVSIEDRDVVQDAVNAGKTKVVLVGIKAGGAGLNLQKKAFRNIFLDKPWTPADMEQAVGRTWRTGAKADTVHVHHMKVANTTDERKYTKLGNKIQLVDALAFADQGEEYLGGMVAASLKRLIGTFDDSVTEWTPEQHKELMQLAGLNHQDQPFASIPAMREHFDIKAFGEASKHEKWKQDGDEGIKEMAIINDLKLKAGQATPKQHAMQKRKISKLAQNWMKEANAASDHPVAQFIGEDFTYGSEGSNSVAAERADYSPDKKAPRKSKVPDKDLPPSMPLEAEGHLKLHDKSTFELQDTDKNPFKPSSEMWHFWEAIRRTRPTGVEDAKEKVASWLHDYSKDSTTPMGKREAKEVTEEWLGKRKVLEKFQQKGLLKVKS